ISVKLAEHSNRCDSQARLELHQQRNDAFARLEAATDQFHAIVRKYRDEIVGRDNQSSDMPGSQAN
ncbi:MAG TPA: hypothetical protein VFO86_09630, partial [Terriglobia bacterium]|nr:hypothetical protein [Terriglobia bacterium]